MIYLQNTKIIKDIEILQDLPALNTPVLSDIETGATIVLGTQLSVSNLPTGATLYVNGSAVQGSTFTITPVATARNNGYNYTINLQYKGVSGYEDSEISSYTLKMKNPTPTVSLDSGVFTQSSKSITVTRQENVYEVEQDQRCIRGEYDSTSEGTWCNVLMLSDTSTYCQFNFFIRETDYADRSDVVTRYYHIASSESMPTPTISYDENNENFTISVNNWPSDPVNGSYMSSNYTIYYSINSETVNTQYNSIAISCNAGDVIRAKVVSDAGFADSATSSYNVPVPAPTSIAFNQATYNINQGYSTQAHQASFAAFTVTDNLGNDVTNDVVLSSANGMIILANNKHLIPITPGTDTITATYTPSGGTALTTTCTVVSGNETYLVEAYGDSTKLSEPITLSDTDEHDYKIKIVDVNGNNTIGYNIPIFGNIAITNAVSSNSSVITAEAWLTQQGFIVQAQSTGNTSVAVTLSVSNFGTCTYQAQFAYSEAEPEPSFSDNYAFYSEEHEEIFDDGGEFYLFNGSSSIVKLFDVNNDTELTPDSTPTCSSDDDEGVTITWSDNDNAFTITALDADLEIPVSIEVTIDGVTYNVGFTVFTVAASE